LSRRLRSGALVAPAFCVVMVQGCRRRRYAGRCVPLAAAALAARMQLSRGPATVLPSPVACSTPGSRAVAAAASGAVPAPVSHCARRRAVAGVAVWCGVELGCGAGWAEAPVPAAESVAQDSRSSKEVVKELLRGEAAELALSREEVEKSKLLEREGDRLEKQEESALGGGNLALEEDIDDQELALRKRVVDEESNLIVRQKELSKQRRQILVEADRATMSQSEAARLKSRTQELEDEEEVVQIEEDRLRKEDEALSASEARLRKDYRRRDRAPRLGSVLNLFKGGF